MSITGLTAWEQPGWIAPGDDGLPDWLVELRKRHLDAVTEYQAAIAGVVDVSGQVEAEARQWRRSVRDAVAQGQTPPEREGGDAIGEARIEVAQEDAGYARAELAVVACEVLNAIRERRDEFMPHFYTASAELRYALGRGPDGLTEAERQRRERQAIADAEEAIPNIDEHPELTELGSQEVIADGAAA